MANVFSKIFGTKQDREIRRMVPMVEEVNEIILALHDYGENPKITELLGIGSDEIIAQSAEFEKRWSESVQGIAEDDPEKAQKLRKAEDAAAAWFLESADGSPPVYDWKAVYWGIQQSSRAKDKWAAAGDEWIIANLEERVGKPLYRELRAELDSEDKNAFEAWLAAKKELTRRIRPALVARTRAWQRVLAERAREIEEEVKKADEDARKDLWKKRTNEVLDPIKIEVFSLVRETCYLRLGDSWDVRGFSTTWDMFPFNVQIIGAIVLHEGKITEMRTGEGKTLVATMPLYLNALVGRGAHLVTHNDFLAFRDKEWMGPIYEYLGLTVGVIHTGMNPQERRPEYSCDITYGTNNEFGFDYLRDNMVHSLDRKAQRSHAYAIVDEVDSLLIDEARTPLIISGPTQYVDRGYQRYKPGVEKLFRAQQRLSNDRAAQAEKLIAEENEMEAAKLLLMVKRSTPKHKRLLRFQKEGSIKRLIDDIELMHMREKKLHELDAENFFTYDEHMRAVELNDKGRELLNPRDPEAFTLPDLSTGLDAIDKNKELPAKQKLKKKEELYQEYASKSEMLNNHHALLKAYVLFSKDEDYIVDGGKVVIVDSFTGRPQPGRRYSDGLHEALEAKEGVRVQEETQTVASITHQNYFRMYEKLAGMTGTAMTDANEFVQVYKMDDPIAIPTNKPVRRIDYPDIVYATRNEKYQAVVDEIEEWHATGRPILVGTTSVDVSEILSRLLKRKGINHNVLNAKQHQREAEIVREAGKKHKVTIATNMAGRGTDIKLTPEIFKIETTCKIEEAQTEQEIEKFKNSKGCQGDFPTGLLIIGTERHESRRIDNQLRGRSGRQGDPGASRFFLSLEDDLLRIFGADRMQKAIESFSKKEMEPISTPLVTRAIENAQKRVEQNNFEMRKRLLEYDDVMNRQREEIYTTRDEILAGDDLDGLCKFIYGEVINLIINERLAGNIEEWDWEGLQSDFISFFMVGFEIPSAELRAKLKPDDLSEKLLILADRAFTARRESMAEKFDDFQKIVLLMTIDTRWRDHLREMDELKKGIGLRQYGQKDPVIEYKREAFGKYEEMVRTFQKEVTKLLFRAQLKQAPARRQQAPVHAHKDDASGIPAASAPGEQPRAQGPAVSRPQQGPLPGPRGKQKPVTVKKKVGRNDPCPCGSGKKYKKCCYPQYG